MSFILSLPLVIVTLNESRAAMQEVGSAGIGLGYVFIHPRGPQRCRLESQLLDVSE
jgi:hypothetical protein